MDAYNTSVTLNNTISSLDILKFTHHRRIINIFNYSPNLVISLFTLNIVEILLTILGNLTVILTVVAYRQLWVPSNILVASLAVADLIIGLILQIGSAWNYLNTLLQGKRHCGLLCIEVILFTGYVIIGVSLFHLSLITLDRFAAIVYPLRYVTIITMSRTKKALVFAWISSFVFGSLITIPSPISYAMRGLWYLFMLMTCVFMISLYGKLYCISRKHAKRIQNEIHSITPGAETKEERRGLKTAAIVTVAMVTSYVPIVALELQMALHPTEGDESAQLVHDILFQFARMLILFNSTLNPLVYFFRSEKLRAYSWKLLKSIPRTEYKVIELEEPQAAESR